MTTKSLMERLNGGESVLCGQGYLFEMERRGYSVTERVYKRRDDALRYAVAKALRRGLKRLPVELAPWAPPGLLREAPSGLASSGEHVDQ